MNYFANVDAVHIFCREIFPAIKKKVPDTQFYIVGSNPGPSINKLHNPSRGIHVTGWVPDIREYLNEASVCVVPLRIAQGIQNKILEAMSSGLAVVTTSDPVRGLNVKEGENIFIGDNPMTFALV